MNKNSKRIAFILSVCLMALTACTSKDKGGADSFDTAGNSQADTATISTAAPAGLEGDGIVPAKKMKITVDVKDYKDDELTFEYEGKEYTLPLTEDRVADITSRPLPEVDPNERIVHNPYGVKVAADLEIAADMTEIFKCSIEAKNCKTVDNDRSSKYYMKQYEGSVYTISSDTETYYLDLNTLGNNYKEVPPEDEEVAFSGLVLGGDKLVLGYVRRVVISYYDEDGELIQEDKGMTNDDKYHYFGVVQSLDEDKAVVKLNYMDKVLTVPRYLTDGELSEGAKVAVVLRDTPEELAASQDQERDFAVFYTDTEAMLEGFEEFENVIYCTIRLRSNGTGYRFDLIRTDGTKV